MEKITGGDTSDPTADTAIVNATHRSMDPDVARVGYLLKVSAEALRECKALLDGDLTWQICFVCNANGPLVKRLCRARCYRQWYDAGEPDLEKWRRWLSNKNLPRPEPTKPAQCESRKRRTEPLVGTTNAINT
jgi:hypothetical protein